MDKLYLSIKKSIDNCVKMGYIPQVTCEWECNQFEENTLKNHKYPLVLFKVQSIVYDCPYDKYLTGEMVFLVKVIFEGQINRLETQQEVYAGFDLVKKLPALLRTVESEATGPIAIKRMEVLDCNDNKHCFQYISSVPYYPACN